MVGGCDGRKSHRPRVDAVSRGGVGRRPGASYRLTRCSQSGIPTSQRQPARHRLGRTSSPGTFRDHMILLCAERGSDHRSRRPLDQPVPNRPGVYPTLRQFRQPIPGDWNSTICAAREAFGAGRRSAPGPASWDLKSFHGGCSDYYALLFCLTVTCRSLPAHRSLQTPRPSSP